MPVIVTEPWSDFRIGARSAVLVKEVSGLTSHTAALAATGLAMGSQHPRDSAYVVEDFDISRLSIDFWRITFAFAPSSLGGNDQPPSMKTLISWDPGTVSDNFDRSADGYAVLNSAREPFEQPVHRIVEMVHFGAVRWEPTPFDPQRAVKYLGAVNSKAFKIQGHEILEGQALCTRYSPLDQYPTDARWIQVGYSFELRDEGHDVRRLDAGYRGWVDDVRLEKRVQCEIWHKSTMRQITQPVRFNGRGKPIGDDFVGPEGQTLVEVGPPPGADVEQVLDSDGKLLAVFLIYKRNTRRNLLELGL